MFAIFRTTTPAFNAMPISYHRLPTQLYSRARFFLLSSRMANTRSAISSPCRTTTLKIRQVQMKGNSRVTSASPRYESRRIYDSALYETQPNNEADDDGLSVSISSDTKTNTKTMKIYVGNISPDTTPEVLVEHFRSQCSLLEGSSDISVIDVSIPNYDPSRRYGFVILAIDKNMELSCVEKEVESLIKRTNGNEIDGMPIRVNSYFRKGRQTGRIGSGDKEVEQYSQLQQLQQVKGDTEKTRYTIECPPTEEKMLRKIVTKHVSTNEKYLSCRPLATHTVAAFEEAQVFVNKIYLENGEKADIIIDSGCGTGRSTLLLGQRFPNCIVLGIDRSLSRLERNFVFREQLDADEVVDGDDDLELKNGGCVTHEAPALRNVLLIRAELTDFWRCCLNAGWNIRRHYLLYPNPYPKVSRLKSRWYAHPSFPTILKLGGDIIIRSNWKGYLDEFQSSVKFCDDYLSQTRSLDVGGESDSAVDISKQNENYAEKYVSIDYSRNGPQELEYHDLIIPMTNFEKKYYLCGETTYELELTDKTLQDSQ